MGHAALLDEVRKFLDGPPSMIVDGRPVGGASGRTIAVEDPASRDTLTDVPRGGAADVDAAVAAARAAFEGGRWLGLRPGKRAEVLFRVADLIKRRLPELAQLEALDAGKPIKLASGEVWAAAECFRYYSGWPTKVRGETVPTKDDLLVYSLREPMGVCGGIIPWNYPLLMAAWKIAPALAFGNTIVLKPAEQTPLTALRLAQLCLEAGVPEGVVNVVTGLGEEAGAALAAHDDVDKIAFTGSTEVGRKILAASAGNLKRVTLELGGKSPNVVFADADMGRAARGSMLGVFTNSGQMCTAGTRILVEQGVHDDFVEALVAAASKMTVGHPLDESTGMGPLISEAQLERVMGYIDVGRAEGARIAAGGRRPPDLDGYYVEPTIFTSVTNDMRIAQEEIFGPVAAVVSFTDVDDAIAIANDTRYGLASAVWTCDLSKAHRVARGIRAGTVWVNTTGLYDPAVSFGGFKQSGFGRELGASSIETYTQSKAVWIGLD